jgi:hypothetical protein
MDELEFPTWRPTLCACVLHVSRLRMRDRYLGASLVPGESRVPSFFANQASRCVKSLAIGSVPRAPTMGGRLHCGLEVYTQSALSRDKGNRAGPTATNSAQTHKYHKFGSSHNTCNKYQYFVQTLHNVSRTAKPIRLHYTMLLPCKYNTLKRPNTSGGRLTCQFTARKRDVHTPF